MSKSILIDLKIAYFSLNLANVCLCVCVCEWAVVCLNGFVCGVCVCVD